MAFLYIVTNLTGRMVSITDAGGEQVLVNTTALVELSLSQYANYVTIFGPNNVVLAPGQPGGSPYQYTSLGNVPNYVVGSSPRGLPTPIPPGVTSVEVLVSNSGAGVMYRDDGTTPTQNSGIYIAPGGSTVLTLTNLAVVAFVSQTGAPAYLTVAYYR